jgi:hypothetical protein
VRPRGAALQRPRSCLEDFNLGPVEKLKVHIALVREMRSKLLVAAPWASRPREEPSSSGLLDNSLEPFYNPENR